MYEYIIFQKAYRLKRKRLSNIFLPESIIPFKASADMYV